MPRQQFRDAPNAIQELNDVVDGILERRTQASNRLDHLANFCIRQFEMDGLPPLRGGEGGEETVRGIGRPKSWDVALISRGRPRLLVSLKSIRDNLVGTVPNRGDDLMGECANVQHLYPEVVIGYVAMVNRGAEIARKSGRTVPEAQNKAYIETFRNRLTDLAVRKAPVWGAGLIEAFWLIEFDSRRPPGSRVVDGTRATHEGDVFFKTLTEELDRREPCIRVP